MKTANVHMTLTKEGHDVFLTDVTPAELMLLVAEHHHNVGKDPVISLEELGDEDRTPQDEVRRLRLKYAGNKIAALFPGATPSMPTTFEDAKKTGFTQVLPTSKLTEFKLL